MPRSQLPLPNEIELRILQFAWTTESFTAREAYEAVREYTDRTSNRVSTIVKEMAKRQSLREVGDVHPKKYAAVATREEVQRVLVRETADKVFGGSVKAMLVSMLQEVDDVSAGELERLAKRVGDFKEPE